MACVHVVTDGCAALPPGAANDYGICIVPRSVVIGGRTVTMGGQMALHDVLAAASAASDPITFGASDPAEYRTHFGEILGWGVEVVSIHGPPSLGGDAAAARAAAASLGGDAPVTVIETPWCSAALGLLTLRAAVLGQDETPRAELGRLVDGSTVQPSFYLVGGGKSAAGRAGGRDGADWALQPTDARPLLQLMDGHLEVVAWYDAIGDALRGLAGAVTAEIGSAAGPTHLALVSAGADAEAAALAAFLESRLYPSEIWLGPVDAVIGAIGGQGAFGVAFYADPASE